MLRSLCAPRYWPKITNHRSSHQLRIKRAKPARIAGFLCLVLPCCPGFPGCEVGPCPPMAPAHSCTARAIRGRMMHCAAKGKFGGRFCTLLIYIQTSYEGLAGGPGRDYNYYRRQVPSLFFSRGNAAHRPQAKHPSDDPRSINGQAAATVSPPRGQHYCGPTVCPGAPGIVK